MRKNTSLFLVFVAAAAALLAQSPRRQQRQDQFTRIRGYPNNRIPPGARLAALAEMSRMPAAIPAAPWRPIGPRPINVYVEATNTGAPQASGRVSAMVVDPRNASVVYLGASGGGVWKTVDAGRNWIPIADDQPSLAIGSIALAPSNPDIVYVGTGEQNNSGDSYYGAGVLKSIDGGVTWTQLPGPFATPYSSGRLSGGAHIGAMAVHPTNPAIVLAGIQSVLSGVYRSSDGGVSWTNVLPGAAGTDVVFDPANPNTAYAALGTAGGATRNGVYKSTDGGLTWNLSGGSGPTGLPTTSVGRIALAIAPSSPNIVYAGIQNSTTAGGALLGLYKSTDGGQNWTRLNAPDYCTPQCSYNNVVRVHPLNPNIVVVAGLQPYRSFDGGNTWTSILLGANGTSAHYDHHALAFSADGSLLYAGNDGGAYSTTATSVAPGPWANLNGTLAITEFSSNVSIDPDDVNVAHAGTQDNGTLTYYGSLTWDQSVSGDGGFTAIDPAVHGLWYGSFNGIQPFKLSAINSIYDALSDPFRFFSGNSTNGLNTADRNDFYAPIQMDPVNPQRLYLGSFRVYVTNDSAGRWSLISPDLTRGGAISTIAVSPSYPKAVCVGTTDGKVQVTNTADQGPATIWVDRTAGLPGRAVSHIAIDPLNPSIFYVALSGFGGIIPNDSGAHVLKTTDFGETWNDISGNLPNVPVNDLVLDPDLPDTMYIATDVGVFATSDGGQTWATLGTGLPHVLVQGLALHRATRTLRAATYGRSMWDLSVPLPGPSTAPRITSLNPAVVPAGSGPATITISGSNFVPASAVWINGSPKSTTYVSDTTLTLALSGTDLAAAGRNTLLVFNPLPGSGFSNAMNLSIGPPPAFAPNGLVSSANPATIAPLVPGSLATIFGTSLAAAIATPAAPPLPFSLGGVTVEVAGIPAPLLYVSPTQINFQVPWEIEGYSRTVLSITNGTLTSPPIPVPVALADPAIFSADGSGTGQGAIRIAAPGSPIAAPAGAFPGSRPARGGESLQIYATGLGSISRLTPDGQIPVGLAISRIPAVAIGGVPAYVSFAGAAPGTVGVFQVNVEIPPGIPAGHAVPVTMSLSGATSNTVTIALQ